MDGYIGKMFLLLTVVAIGVLFYVFGVRYFNSKTSQVASASKGMSGPVTFDVVSPPDRQPFYFTADAINGTTVYVAPVTIEIKGNGDILNGKTLTVSTPTAGYYVWSTEPTNTTTLAEIRAKPYATFTIPDTTGDYTFTAYVISDHTIYSGGETVELDLKVEGGTPVPVYIVAYPSS